jgi:hypothetical protein
MVVDFAIRHPLIAALGKPIDGNALLSAAFGQDAEASGGGDDDRYLTAIPLGLEAVTARDGTVKAIFFKAAGIEDFAPYQDALPNGLTFADSRAVVRQALGDPVRAGEAGGTGIMAIPYAWDRYEDGTHYLRCEYEDGDASIRMVTIGLADPE